MKTPEQSQCRFSGIFIVNFEHMSDAMFSIASNVDFE